MSERFDVKSHMPKVWRKYDENVSEIAKWRLKSRRSTEPLKNLKPQSGGFIIGMVVGGGFEPPKA